MVSFIQIIFVHSLFLHFIAQCGGTTGSVQKRTHQVYTQGNDEKIVSYISPQPKRRISTEHQPSNKISHFEDSLINQIQTLKINDEFCYFDCQKHPLYQQILQEIIEVFKAIESLDVLHPNLIKIMRENLINKVDRILLWHPSTTSEHILKSEITPFANLHQKLFYLQLNNPMKMSEKESYEYLSESPDIWNQLFYYSWNFNPKSDIWISLTSEIKLDSAENTVKFLFGDNENVDFGVGFDNCMLIDGCISHSYERLCEIHTEIKRISALDLPNIIKDLLILMSIYPDDIFKINVDPLYRKLKQRAKSESNIYYTNMKQIYHQLQDKFTLSSLQNIKKIIESEHTNDDSVKTWQRNVQRRRRLHQKRFARKHT